MKVSIAVLFVALSGAVAVARTAPPVPAPRLSAWQRHQRELFRDSAPADEYFGKMKMSYLGMNNTFRDASISSGDHTTDPAIANRVALAENALDDWARKYPRDPQLARTYYLATVVERKIWIRANQERAWIYLNRLVQLFPNTYFGKLLKADLAIGFTEHSYALPEPCPTAPPTPPPADEGIDAFYVPPPIEVAPDVPTPTPLPVPTATTLEPGLRAIVLPQPCVPPEATPSPTPAP